MSKPIYVVGQIDVIDHDAYMKEYGLPSFELLKKAGAEVLVSSQHAVVAEGEGGANWTIIVRFETEEAFTAFNADPAYQPLKKLRLEKLTRSGKIFHVEGLR
jgi:uncharacterized protein (DUF1330 family)